MTRRPIDPWEYVEPVCKLGTKFKVGKLPPGVRRLEVPGGWLYQVQQYDLLTDVDVVADYQWHPPVFVPRGRR